MDGLWRTAAVTERPTSPGRPGIPLIQLNRVCKVYHTPAGDFTALEDINLTFLQGEFVSVAGRSGSGKSTLMNMITGIDKPSSGEILVAGQPLHSMSENQMAGWRGRNLGIVFQFYQLIPVLSLLENVLLPMQIAGLFTPEERLVRANQLLERVGLAGQEHKKPHTVSGGQQQSAAIARALANDPPILIADEPTGNLGSAAAENVFHIFESLSQSGKTVIYVTHDNELAARARRSLRLSDGRLAHDNPNHRPEERKP